MKRKSNKLSPPPNNLVERFYVFLDENNLQVEDDRKIEYGWQCILSCGTRVNIYATGKVLLQGKWNEKLTKYFYGK